jgi:sugar/nucleoside kinase (ribokinase family)
MPIEARIYARCALEDRDALFSPVRALVHCAEYLPGSSTSAFRIEHDEAGRNFDVLGIGDTWRPAELPVIPPEIVWIHVAPLLRSDFPADTLAELGRGRRLSLDGQGLVRRSKLGPLELDADFDPEVLRHVSVLKLSEEEAQVLGDPAALLVPEVVITRGPAGLTVITEGREDHVPAIRVGGHRTGTGDAFAVAYLAARSQGEPPLAAAREASGFVASLLASRE